MQEKKKSKMIWNNEYLVNFIKEIAINNEHLWYKNKSLEEFINSNNNGIIFDYDTINQRNN